MLIPCTVLAPKVLHQVVYNSAFSLPEPYGPISELGAYVHSDKLDDSVTYPYDCQDDPLLHKHEDIKHFDVPAQEPDKADLSAYRESLPDETE